MTQSSILWTNNNTGDGISGGYSQGQLVEMFRALFTNTTNRAGVSPEFLNELAVTGVSSPIAVATGAAIAYGFFYINDASENFSIPTPSSATRIDRIVLRTDWTAQTVRLTRIAGSEGGGAPSITQSAGVTWDMSLAQVSITTGGVITITDEREWLDVTGDGAVTAAKLANDAVTTPKILNANVTAAKLASDAVETAKILNEAVTGDKIANDAINTNRLFSFVRSRKGDLTNWSTPGTATRSVNRSRMFIGAARWTGSGTSGTLDVDFPEGATAFNHTAYLAFVTPSGANDVMCGAIQSDKETFQIQWSSPNSKTQVDFFWLVIAETNS